MDIDKVNSMDFGEFVDVFGNVIERCPLIAAAVWSQRPFSNLEDLEKHFFAFIDALPQSGQEGILRCHPDLAGPELQRGTLTAESRREQAGAGLTSLDAAERLRLAELNAQYRARFGFPFVLAARLSDRAAVPGELARRLRRPPAEELRAALGEVKKIGRLRLADLLGAAGLASPERARQPGTLGARRAGPGREAGAGPDRRPHARAEGGEP